MVVLLWSPRSDACVQLVDTLAGLAAEDNGKWSLATVNVDVAPRVAQIFGVEAVPTVVALAAGQPLYSFQGVQPPEQLRRWVDALLSATAGKLRGPSGSAEPDGSRPGAGRGPRTARGRRLRRRHSGRIRRSWSQSGQCRSQGRDAADRLSSRAQPRNAPDAVAAADAAPDDIDAAFAAADVQILNQDVSAAFDRLIALVRSTSGDERTGYAPG